MAAPTVDTDDDFDTHECYRHPGRETALSCIECDRPICVECAVQGAVGFKCPDDARTSRAARGVVPAGKAARGIAAGSVVALVLGALLAIAPIPFFGIILGYVVGLAVGATVRAASGGYRDPALARFAAVAAAVGVLVLPTVWILTEAISGQGFFFAIAAAGFAAFGAFNRAA